MQASVQGSLLVECSIFAEQTVWHVFSNKIIPRVDSTCQQSSLRQMIRESPMNFVDIADQAEDNLFSPLVIVQ